MIQFVLKDNKVRFEVNLTAAEKAGLTFSSQLLKVATSVKRDSPGGKREPMRQFRNSLSRKLTAMNMLVSGGALLLASAAFFAIGPDHLSRKPCHQHFDSGADHRLERGFSFDLQRCEIRANHSVRSARVPAHHLCGHLYGEGRLFRGLLARPALASRLPLPRFGTRTEPAFLVRKRAV